MSNRKKREKSMRGQLVIDVETGENMAFMEEIGLCVKPELGSLGACHFHVTRIVSSAIVSRVGQMDRRRFDRSVDLRGMLDIPEHIATFAKAYAAAEDERSRERQEKLDKAPYESAGPLFAKRDLTAALFAPLSPEHLELDRQKHSIGRELHALLVQARARTVRRILIADDDEAQREVLAEYFEHKGFTVVTVANAVALRGALDIYPDIVGIVTDNNMPPLARTGLHVLEEIRGDRRYAHIKRVLVSGVQDTAEETLRGAVERAGATFFSKPMDAEQVLKVLQSDPT